MRVVSFLRGFGSRFLRGLDQCWSVYLLCVRTSLLAASVQSDSGLCMPGQDRVKERELNETDRKKRIDTFVFGGLWRIILLIFFPKSAIHSQVNVS